MPRLLKWTLGVAVGLMLLLGGLLLGVRAWLASDDFRERAAAQLSQALGVPARIGALSVSLWPLPGVEVDRLAIGSEPPLTLERIELKPVWRSLLSGAPAIDTVLLRDAVLPQQALAALMAGVDRKPAARPATQAPSTATVIPTLPRELRLERIVWVNERGGRIPVDATLQRNDSGKGWDIRVAVGGGTIRGTLRQEGGEGRGAPRLAGSFDTAGVEVSALTVPSRTLSGRLDAHTELRAGLAGLPDSLGTDTRFTVRSAVVHGIDLAQAVRTVGLNRGGETRLDTLAGRLVTRGKALQLDNLVASSGALSASGTVAATAARQLSGHVTVSLANASAGGALGVPLVVGGTLDAPSVTLSRGALVGAAIGTAIAPGLGTGAGASVGDKLGGALKGLFGK